MENTVTSATVKDTPTAEQLLDMYERMLLIRRVEKQLSEDFKAGQLPGAVHLYVGQEAVAVGMCEHLGNADWITGTHRGHGHYLAKGGDPKSMLAEIYGRANGICKGMGGSMHVADFSKGIVGANGIVGGGLAITAGAALAAKLDGKGQIAVCFFGDGAANQGVFMETLNVSTLWNLPMIFMCEHNTYSEFSPTDTVTAGELPDRARAFGIPVTVVDGNDVTEVWKAAGAAVDRARSGDGPSFIEARTYRIHGHIEAEVHFLSSTYREEEEIEQWRQRDPIDRLGAQLLSSGVADEAAMAEIDARIQEQVAEAEGFAQTGEPADENLVFDLMSVGQQ
ncbi:MAG: thiamine pyrophosphate-dependent dehydrogenase E1 component subunit alpha [Deltaproteobacteria bacterium]|nr:thiamine pyrophosphate-dependent dehydrogenase E1 component subunit alpha [Deltaproteobacteria bacterium]